MLELVQLAKNVVSKHIGLYLAGGRLQNHTLSISLRVQINTGSVLLIVEVRTDVQYLTARSSQQKVAPSSLSLSK